MTPHQGYVNFLMAEIGDYLNHPKHEIMHGNFKIFVIFIWKILTWTQKSVNLQSLAYMSLYILLTNPTNNDLNDIQE